MSLSIIFWFLLLLGNYLCLFSLKSISLGLFLLLCSFSISVLMSMFCLSWYSLIFFLVYMGGLLVLFVYTSSLKFNPSFSNKTISPFSKFLFKLKILFLLMVSLFKMGWNINHMGWNNLDGKKFSINLFNEEEMIFLVNVGILLLLMLWMMNKLSFQNRGALRPLF